MCIRDRYNMDAYSTRCTRGSVSRLAFLRWLGDFDVRLDCLWRPWRVFWASSSKDIITMVPGIFLNGKMSHTANLLFLFVSYFFSYVALVSRVAFFLLRSRTRYASTWFAYSYVPWLFKRRLFLCLTICDHKICISTMKNQEGHWVYCWCRWVERTV